MWYLDLALLFLLTRGWSPSVDSYCWSPDSEWDTLTVSRVGILNELVSPNDLQNLIIY